MSVARRVVLSIVLGLLASGFLGPLLAMVSVRAGTDPWLGAHAAIVCARVCPGCRGPYVVRGGTRVNGSSRGGAPSKMYCQPASGALPTGGDLDAYELASGSLWVIAGSVVVVAPLLALASFAALSLTRRRAARP